MSKYVIELDEDVKILQSISVTQHGNAYTNTNWVANLEELNSDYINEHYGELQDEAYKRGYEEGRKVGIKDGMCDAWEAARKIFVDTAHGGVTLGALQEIFGTKVYTCIMQDNTAQEAIDKIKAYENKQKDRIEVGDEVRHKNHNTTWTAVVVKREEDVIYLMGHTGAVADYQLSGFEKTGRHFDIQSILEAMRK
jgi:hypothetical protein